MNTFLRNTISRLYKAVSAPLTTTRDALADRLQGMRDTASLLYNRMMENMGYGQEILKDIVEKEAEGEEPAATKEGEEPAATKEEEEAKEQQQEPASAKEQQEDDDEQYDTVAKIKLVYKGKRVKEFRVTGNIHNSNKKMIMTNITPHIEMRTKVIYSLKSEIHRSAGEIKDYSKTLNSPPGMLQA